MSALAWWAIPVVATLLALGWLRFAGRGPRQDDLSGVDTHRRFLDALARRGRGRPDRDGPR